MISSGDVISERFLSYSEPLSLSDPVTVRLPIVMSILRLEADGLLLMSISTFSSPASDGAPSSDY